MNDGNFLHLYMNNVSFRPGPVALFMDAIEKGAGTPEEYAKNILEGFSLLMEKFSKETPVDAVRNILPAYVGSGDVMRIILEDAEKDPVTFRGVAAYCGDQITRRKPIPPTLEKFVVDVLRGKKEPGHKGALPHMNFARDLFLCAAVGLLQEKFGISPTKNAENNPETLCGCDIVEKTCFDLGVNNYSNISSEAIKKAYFKFKTYLF